MTTQKKAPSAVGAAAEGENTSKLIEENNVNSNQDTTTPQYSATDVAEALAEIDAPGFHCVEFEPGTTFYSEPLQSVTLAEESLGTTDSDGWVTFARFIDREGSEGDLPDGYREKHLARVPGAELREFKKSANSGIRVGDYLAISYGLFRVDHDFERDGVRMVEMVTREEEQRRKHLAQETWTEKNRDLIQATMPSEATSFEVWDYDGAQRSTGVLYERVIGPLKLSWGAEIANGKVLHVDAQPAVLIEVGRTSDEIGNIDEMRELASSLTAAIEILEAVAA